MDNQDQNSALLRAIEIVGGRSKLAYALEVHPQTVWMWVHGKQKIIPVRALQIEKITNGRVKAEEILPDYEWEKVK